MELSLRHLLLCCFLIGVAGTGTDLVDNLLKPRDKIPRCSFEMCPKAKPGVINIHFIPHTHLDPSWRSEYAYSVALTKDILVSVAGELLKSKSRTFTVAEIGLFREWFDTTNAVFNIIVRKFVEEGRLEFAGGGWVQHDEACTDYEAILHHMTLGHRWINDTFGSCALPTAGWQMDPFGHSRETAALFAQMGFDGLFLGRIDHRERLWRKDHKTLQFIWEADDMLRRDIFTTVLPTKYEPPYMAFFDHAAIENADNFTIDFLRELSTCCTPGFATNHVPVLFGSDFSYTNASTWYVQMDLLMDTINRNHGSQYQAYYSTPSCYLRSVNQAAVNVTLTRFRGDFFPYFDNEFWTGFYTTRPGFKRYVRHAHHFRRVCLQVAVLAKVHIQDYRGFDAALALAQHHDSITGTSEAFVIRNLTEIIAVALPFCEAILSPALEALVTTGENRNFFPTFCHLLNQSECPVSEGKEKFYVMVHNPHSRELRTAVRFPIANSGYKVTAMSSRIVPSYIVPIQHALFHVAERHSSALHDLVFLATVPPMGIASFLVERFRGASVSRMFSRVVKEASDEYVLKNMWYEVAVDAKTCLLKSIRLLETGVKVDLRQVFAWYPASYGHYVFEPTSNTASEFTRNITCRAFNNPLVQEVHQWVTPWLSQVIRLYANSDYVEFDWIVGPVPIGSPVLGRDVVIRFKSNLQNEGVFHTDSNGRQTIQRTANSSRDWNLDLSRFAVQANYFPVVSWIYIQGGGLQLTVLPDRAQGGTSFHVGEIELMVQRRHTRTDSKGLSQALDDLGAGSRGEIIRGRHLLHLAPVDRAQSRVRDLASVQLSEPLLFFADATSPKSRGLVLHTFTGLRSPLPAGVRVLSLEKLAGSRGVLLRLQYARSAGEHTSTGRSDPDAPQRVLVHLQTLLSTYKLRNIRETTLTASHWLSDARKPLRWDRAGGNQRPGPRPGDVQDSGGLSRIELLYGEIRTFIGDI